MIKSMAKFSLILLSLVWVIGCSGFSLNDRNKDLSYDQLIDYVDQYWFEGTAVNFTVEQEEDLEDLHLLLLSYQSDASSPLVNGLAVFKRLQNNKYKYVIFDQSPIWSSQIVVLLANKGTSHEKKYGLFFGILTDEQPAKYLITVNGDKEFTDIIEKNKYFIRAYDLNDESGFGMRPIYD